MSNSLDPDQDRPSVGPVLGLKCLKRLSADVKSCSKQGNSSVSNEKIFYLFKLMLYAQVNIFSIMSEDFPGFRQLQSSAGEFCSSEASGEAGTRDS